MKPPTYPDPLDAYEKGREADRIREDKLAAALRERIKELEAALEPLAAVGRVINVGMGAEDSSYLWAENATHRKPVRLSVGDARRAAAILKGKR